MAEPSPSYATIAADGLNNGTISNTVCNNMNGACDWTSGADFVTIGQGSTANQCGDVCFDHEAAGHVVTTGFQCKSTGPGCATVFFTASSVEISNGVCVIGSATSCIQLRNSNQAVLTNLTGTVIDNVNSSCIDPTIICTFAYLDSNYGTSVKNSKILNGTISGGGYSAGLEFNNDTFLFTVPGAGFSVPSLRNGALNVFKNLTINSLVAQPAGIPALTATNIDFNYQNTYIFDSITTLGYPIDVQYANNGGNVPATFTIRNSTLGAGVVVKGTSNAGVVTACTNNYSLNGTTPVTCPN